MAFWDERAGEREVLRHGLAAVRRELRNPHGEVALGNLQPVLGPPQHEAHGHAPAVEAAAAEDAAAEVLHVRREVEVHDERNRAHIVEEPGRCSIGQNEHPQRPFVETLNRPLVLALCKVAMKRRGRKASVAELPHEPQHAGAVVAVHDQLGVRERFDQPQQCCELLVIAVHGDMEEGGAGLPCLQLRPGQRELCGHSQRQQRLSVTDGLLM
mmetsp:Transcript_49428/g.155509  ORF Transcript_49428/g.155509 Transcript_49428/m.155509 type:complete len:212 (+) Transcript_49428:85-720(+)